MRTAELISQLGHGQNESEVQSLTQRANELNLSMQRGIAEARHMMFGPAPDSSSPLLSPGIEHQNRSWSARRSGKAPWDPNSDSESDDGRRDTSRLTEDGKHVIQKQYKLINGHYALIAYRLELNEVDPCLLLKLREKRERELARLEAKKKKREGKRRARNGESNNNIGKKEEDSKLYHKTFTEKKATEKRRASRTSKPAAQLREKTSESSSPRHPARGSGSRGNTAGEQAKGKAPQEPKARIREERHETRTPAGKSEMRKTHKNESPASSHPSNSFRARAEQNGFRPIPQWGVSDEEYEEGPMQAEDSKAPAARLALRKAWMEKFAEDITSASPDSSSDADSVVTVIKAPVREPRETKCKSPDYGKSRRRSCGVKQEEEEEEEEDLDIWHRIADEELRK
ncbi:hypothetical protein F4803DRAFT_546646 [Xylaria telfairii]|nr:hypothetical protein F4803DRAFT_546646 [Xylaria telfairii]